MNIDCSETEGSIFVIMSEACLRGIEAKYAEIWYLLISPSLLERGVADFGPECRKCGVFMCSLGIEGTLRADNLCRITYCLADRK